MRFSNIKWISCFFLFSFCTEIFCANCKHEPGTFFSQNEWAIAAKRSKRDEDVIVLKDGKMLFGHIFDFPKLRVLIGELPLDLNDIAALATGFSSGHLKMQVISREGYEFVCNVPKQVLRIIESTQSLDTYHDLELDTIDTILFKERSSVLCTTNKKLYHIKLSNGDLISATLADESVKLSNGWNDFSINTESFVQLHFDGGLYGRLLDENGQENAMEFAFIKDKLLLVDLMKSNETIGIPWENIRSITLKPPMAHLRAEKQESGKNDDWNSGLETQLTNLQKKLSALSASKNLLLDFQNRLVANLELEMTRNYLFAKSQSHLLDKFNRTHSHCKKLEGQLQRSCREFEDFKKQEKSSQREKNEQVAWTSKSLQEEKEHCQSLALELEKMAQENGALHQALKREKMYNQGLEESVNLSKQAYEMLKKSKEDGIVKIKEELDNARQEMEREKKTFETNAMSGLQILAMSEKKLLKALKEKEIENQNLQLELKTEKKQCKSLKEELAQAATHFEHLKKNSDKIRQNGELIASHLQAELDKERRSLKQLSQKIKEFEKGNLENLELLEHKENEIKAAKEAICQIQANRDEAIGGFGLKIAQMAQENAALKTDVNREKGYTRDLESEHVLTNHILQLTMQVLKNFEKQRTIKYDAIETLTFIQKHLLDGEYLKNSLEEERTKVESLKRHLTALLPKYDATKEKSQELSSQLLLLQEELAKTKLSLKESIASKEVSHPSLKKVHIVTEGENLNNLSVKYYGTASRWSDIYKANVDVISEVNTLKVGTALVIPQ